jgi:hypothetical protein
MVAGAAATMWWAADRGPEVGQQAQSPTPTPGQGQPGQGQPGNPRIDELPAAVLGQIRSEKPEEAIRGLSALRDTAFSTGKHELLQYVNVQGSAAAAADGKISDELKGSGLVLAGFSTTLVSVSVEGAAGPDRATVAVSLEPSAYEEQDAAGKVVRARPAGKPQELRVVLLRGDGAWRITEILAKQA